MSQYTLEQLLKFLNDVGNNRRPDTETLKAAYSALHDHLFLGTDLHKQYFQKNKTGRVIKKRKQGQHGGAFNPNSISVDHPLFPVLMRYAGGEISHTEAVNILVDALDTSNSTAKRILKARKSDALEVYQSEQRAISKK